MHDESEQSYSFMVCMNVINSITHWILGGAAMLAFMYAISYQQAISIFSPIPEHVYLCTIGYVLVMAQGVLIFSPNNGWSKNMKDSDKKVVHWVMQVIGSILGVAGSIHIMVFVSNSFLFTTFSSAHGIFGFLSLICTVITLIGGAAGLFTKKNFITKFIHPAAGCVTLITAFISLCLGFDEYFRGNDYNTFANLGIAFSVIGLVGTLCSASITGFKRIRGTTRRKHVKRDYQIIMNGVLGLVVMIFTCIASFLLTASSAYSPRKLSSPNSY